MDRAAAARAVSELPRSRWCCRERVPPHCDVSFSLIAGNALGVIVRADRARPAGARAGRRLSRRAHHPARRRHARPVEPGRALTPVGYPPQEVELFEGTWSRRTSRASADAEPGKLIAAATAAGVHDIILRPPQGYKTEVGEGGHCSAGNASASRSPAHSTAIRSGGARRAELESDAPASRRSPAIAGARAWQTPSPSRTGRARVARSTTSWC